ncbi:WD40 repeat-like protein [Piromyces finnis]|uniref:WD40 repeat-like protein n=1 Tax=Piromyces finnis TaxID=1754191 RepID=A0A1Y1VBC7_9FUNG|nr:WD40 repeat-like protein [Piromyces finnis]|eukprot:ORX51774.1 WD40 repeat-like protein [Piromyces finnis]
MFNIEKKAFASQVTSLQFINEQILVEGTGPYLMFFNITNNVNFKSVSIFKHSRVHGIRIINNDNCKLIAAYGSKALKIFEYEITTTNNNYDVDLKEKASIELKDWILDAKFLFENEQSDIPTDIALALGHNFVEVYDINLTTKKYEVHSEVNCIIYSAKFYGNTLSTLKLASGTVFNVVILWNVLNKSNGSAIIQEFKGHEGVIFAMDFTDDGKKICSVSDDRTLRVWTINDRKSIVLYGHTSRIWDCILTDKYAITVSEDTTCRVWDYNNESCAACWEGHYGKDIWCVAMSPERDIVATGGGDSGVRLWNLKDLESNKIESTSGLKEISLPNQDTYIDPALKDSLPKKEFIRNFAQVGDKKSIFVTNTGYILANDLSTDESSVLYQDKSFCNYSMIDVSECQRIIGCGDLSGNVLLLSPDNSFKPIKWKAHEGKVFDVYFEKSNNPNIVYFFSYSINNEMFWNTIDISDISNPVVTLKKKIKLTVNTVMCLTYSEEHNILLMGCRHGSVIVYKITNDDSNETIEPVFRYVGAHGRDALTCITIDKSLSTSNSLVFYSTGRDGNYIQFRATGKLLNGDINEQDPIKIEEIGKSKITKGWLEKIIIVNNTKLLLGFFQKRFFVYNDDKKYEVMSIACGGAHRKWYFSTETETINKAEFAFYRKEKLYVYLRNIKYEKPFKEEKLQDNLHGKEIRAIKFIDDSFIESDKPKEDNGLLITGAEDSLLKFLKYEPESSIQIHSRSSIRKHTSVIKNLGFSVGLNKLLFSSGACEELNAWKLEIKDDNSEMMNDSDLYINCVNYVSAPHVSPASSETRIMDMDVYSLGSLKLREYANDNGIHLIIAGYSDSLTRLWIFNENTNKFEVIACGKLTNRCILRTKFQFMSFDDNTKELIALVSATDGQVYFCNCTSIIKRYLDGELSKSEELVSFSKITLHQSGINGIDSKIDMNNKQRIILATGGDDNACSTAYVDISKNEQNILSVSKYGKFTQEFAHSSALTDVKIFNDSYLLTISEDQRLNIWAIKINNEDKIDLELIESRYIDIADVSCMDVKKISSKIDDKKWKVALSGIGIQILYITLN